MGKAFILGGSGFVGRHVALEMAEAGWSVTIASRGIEPIPSEISHLRHVEVDRSTPGDLARVLDGDHDVLIDVIPYERSDAQQIVDLNDRVGHLIAVSTTSVYCDRDGKTLDEADGIESFPNLPVPIREEQSRTDAADRTYSTKKVAIEDTLLEQEAITATVIRPCAIYGPGDTQSREWYFVKRIRDGRRRVPLSYEGRCIFHSCSVLNLAHLIRLAAEKKPHGAYNCGDPEPPDVRRIASTIASVMGHEWDLVPLSDEESFEAGLDTPWTAYRPWIVSMEKASADLDYSPLVTYEQAIPSTVEWIVEATEGKDWRRVLPRAYKYLGLQFDYDKEDALLRGR